MQDDISKKIDERQVGIEQPVLTDSAIPASMQHIMSKHIMSKLINKGLFGFLETAENSCQSLYESYFDKCKV